LNELRDAVRIANTTIDELETGLQKLQLAKKLGCDAKEMTTLEVDCPSDKLGMVIGKQGAQRKQIMEKTHVMMEVEGDKHKIRLTGTPACIEAAVGEIDRIIKSVDEHVTLASEKVNFLTAKHITVLTELRKNHPKVRFDINRGDTKLTLSGMPHDVALARSELDGVYVVIETLTLTNKEVPLLLGKQGSTVEKLVQQHGSAIVVKGDDDKGWTASVIGEPAKVDAAVSEINALLEEYRDVTESVSVDLITRRTLLANGGAPIKELQKKVNKEVNNGVGGILLSFDKDGVKEETSDLVIKGRPAYVALAKPLVEQAIDAVKESIVIIDVDPSIVPTIIGKGGETLKKLREGTSINIEVDRDTGRISLNSANKEELINAEQELRAIMAENQVVRIDFSNPDMAKPMFQRLIGIKKKEIGDVVRMNFDEDENKVVLRGNEENLKKAVEFVTDYMMNNYTYDIPIVPEDEQVLLAGGGGSSIVKLSKETGVALNLNRERNAVTARGPKDSVLEAIKKVNQFLNGGEGFAVSRLRVSDQTLGVVIGKGGKKREALESKYGVKVTTSQSNYITVRGPQDKVDECRIEIFKLISSVTINESISITAEQHASLSKSESLKRVQQSIPVQITLTEDKIKFRGLSMEVRDAVIAVNEQLTGVYEARIDLDATQLATVRAASRDPSHFDRMEQTCEVKVTLDVTESAIKVTGKRNNVKRAKLLVVGFLDFLLPSNFARIKIPKPLHNAVGRQAALAEVSALTGAMIYLDRDLSAIQIQSSELETVQKATDLVKEKIAEAEKLVYVLRFLDTESWLIPFVIGKDGKQINEIRRSSGCTIDVSKEERTVAIIGEDKEKVAAARAVLEALVDKARRECAFIDIPEQAMPYFVGKSGSHINELRKAHGVDIQSIGRKDSTKLKIVGNETGVQAAKAAVEEWVAQWEKAQSGKTLPFEKRHVPVIIGKNGETVRSIEKEFACKMDVDRNTMMVTIRNSTEENQEKAVEKIKELMSAHDAGNAEKRREKRNHNGPAETENEKSPNDDSANAVIDEKPKPPTSQFPVKPVGMAADHLTTRIHPKNGGRDIADDSTVQGGTAAGKQLFNMLVSDEANPSQRKASTNGVTRSAPASGASDEQWDSSTVSSAAVSSDTNDDGTAPNGTTGACRFSSASGFSVRV
jgi:polyribonucleotide nucleotidyltransferase